MRHAINLPNFGSFGNPRLMANLVNLSPAYLRGLRGELRMIAAAAVAVTLLGGAAVALAWSTTLLRRAAAAARWLPAAAAGAVVLLAALATSRPLWQVGHTPHAPSSQTDYIAFLQRAGGFRVDATRSYAEQTMAWLSWYWGPPGWRSPSTACWPAATGSWSPRSGCSCPPRCST